MSATGWEPPQWSQRRNLSPRFGGNGKAPAAPAANPAAGMFLDTGDPALGRAMRTQQAINRPGSTPQQNSAAYSSLLSGSAQGYSGGNRQAQNRTLGLDASGNPAANFGGVAAASNYLTGLRLGGGPQAAADGAQYLRQNGIMPTYNGYDLGRLQQAGGVDLGRPEASQFINQNTDGGGNVMLQAVPHTNGQTIYLDSTGAAYTGTSNGQQYSNGRLVGPAGGGGGFGGSQPPQFGGGASGGYNPGAGGAGPTGLPLEGAVQGSISGILAGGGSPYTQQQAQQLRNQSTDSFDQQYEMDRQEMEADAARRGLNPGEVGGSQRALAQGARNSRQKALTQFDLGQAQASMGNRLSAIGAGTNLMGTQISNEDSIRRYYAMLGASQSGAPMFLGG